MLKERKGKERKGKERRNVYITVFESSVNAH